MENKGLISCFLAALTLQKARMWDMESAKRPDAIVANSKHVQKRIQKYWRQESTVIYPPVSLRRFKVSQKNEDYFLILSALTPFKKIDLAINAFNQNGHRLVIIGYGPEYFRLKAMAKENIELLGYKPDDVVRVYMEHCRALIFPGEEDFGITPIEAMANGKPVLAYGKGGCTESVKPGINGELFIKPSTKSLNQGLERLIKNEKGYDPEKIRSSVERFNESEFEESVRIEIDHLMRRGA